MQQTRDEEVAAKSSADPAAPARQEATEQEGTASLFDREPRAAMRPRRESSTTLTSLTLVAAFALGFVLGRQIIRMSPRPSPRGPRATRISQATRVSVSAEMDTSPSSDLVEIIPGRRYKLRFPSSAAMDAALEQAKPSGTRLVSGRRRVVSAVAMPGTAGDPTDLHGFQRRFGVEVVEDHRYQVELGSSLPPGEFAPDDSEGASLDDVLELIGAKGAWARTRGAGVTLAVVDTGIDGTRAEFPQDRRLGCWPTHADAAWTDEDGHGTMVACIAAATSTAGGMFDGVAPDVGLMACKTEFFDTELTEIYDHLADLARAGQRIVATNSFGVGASPPPLTGQDFPDALADATQAGVLAVFSAGNYHHLVGGDPDGDGPNSIWFYKSRADVLTVGACKLDGTMWYYSSRGPGQDHDTEGNGPKPDVVAPTPENGRVLFGAEARRVRNGWGTSGACAQVAGLVALLWSARPDLDRTGLFDLIRSTAVRLPVGRNAQGNGRIDCAAAVGRAAQA